MHIVSTLLFAISANADNLAVGLSYGIKKIRIGWVSNLLIAIISLLGTILSMLVGKIIFTFIPKNAANLIGSTTILLIGSWSLIKPLLNKASADSLLDHPEKADMDNSANIDTKESIALALALTLNNIGLGIGASITGLNIILTSLFTFIFSMVSIITGYTIGSRYLSKAFSKSATVVSALIMIALGIYEMFI